MAAENISSNLTSIENELDLLDINFDEMVDILEGNSTIQEEVSAICEDVSQCLIYIFIGINISLQTRGIKKKYNHI